MIDDTCNGVEKIQSGCMMEKIIKYGRFPMRSERCFLSFPLSIYLITYTLPLENKHVIFFFLKKILTVSSNKWDLLLPMCYMIFVWNDYYLIIIIQCMSWWHWHSKETKKKKKKSHMCRFNSQWKCTVDLDASYRTGTFWFLKKIWSNVNLHSSVQRFFFPAHGPSHQHTHTHFHIISSPPLLSPHHISSLQISYI